MNINNCCGDKARKKYREEFENVCEAEESRKKTARRDLDRKTLQMFSKKNEMTGAEQEELEKDLKIAKMNFIAKS